MVTIQYTNTPPGDADTAPTLQDAANSFGVRRLDTGATVVVAGVAMTHASPGVYTYQFAEPAPNLTYVYSVRAVNGGVPGFYPGIVSATPGLPLAPYFTYAEFIRRWGFKLVKAASNKDGSQNPNAATQPDFSAIQDAFDYAVDEVHRTLSGGVYATPLDFTPNGGAVPSSLKRGMMLIAVQDLLNAKGVEEKANRFDTRIDRQLKSFYDDLCLYKVGIKQLPAASAIDSRGTGVTMEMAVARTLGFWFWVPDLTPIWVLPNEV